MKKILIFLLFVASLSLNAQQDVKLGDLYTFEDGSKGIVFYVDEGGHGLVVSLQQEKRRWDDETNFVYCQDIVNITNEKKVSLNMIVGLGKNNTSYIIGQLGKNKALAAKYSRDEGVEWYLPSAGELFQLIARANLYGEIDESLMNNNGKKIKGWYWTSSEYNNGEAWRINENGKVKRCSKLATRIHVRAIREF